MLLTVMKKGAIFSRSFLFSVHHCITLFIIHSGTKIASKIISHFCIEKGIGMRSRQEKAFGNVQNGGRKGVVRTGRHCNISPRYRQQH